MFARPTPTMVTADKALPGRGQRGFDIGTDHLVLARPLAGPWPDEYRVLYLGLGCFWGAEKALWSLPGVWVTAVGYMGGFTPHPTYQEVCTGLTGHTETVQVVYDPATLTDSHLIATFFELHDPTQGFRQGGDVGTQYRSAIFTTTPHQQATAEQLAAQFAARLTAAGFGKLTTQICPAPQVGPFYFAEEYHQQYLVRNPDGYCPVHATGVKCGP